MISSSSIRLAVVIYTSAAAISLSLLSAAPAVATPPKAGAAAPAKDSELKSLLAQAEAAMKESRFDDAIAALRQADPLDPSGAAKVELARALDKTGKLAEAASILRAYVEAPPPPKPPKSKGAAPASSVDAAKDLLASVDKRAPRLSVIITGTGSTPPKITLNGKPIDGPGELTLDPGTFLVAAEAKGYLRGAKKVKLVAGDRKKLQLELRKM